MTTLESDVLDWLSQKFTVWCDPQWIRNKIVEEYTNEHMWENEEFSYIMGAMDKYQEGVNGDRPALSMYISAWRGCRKYCDFWMECYRTLMVLYPELIVVPNVTGSTLG